MLKDENLINAFDEADIDENGWLNIFVDLALTPTVDLKKKRNVVDCGSLFDVGDCSQNIEELMEANEEPTIQNTKEVISENEEPTI
ncbi:hypothetical protein FRX31_016401, partial [Thalictrum thalictroides]